MPQGKALDTETILAATEQVLRRHGPAKATVVDVARALGVSHTAVYKHFPSKTALREAVIRRWLRPVRQELDAVTRNTDLAPPERLHAWFTTQLAAKRAQLAADPELVATFRQLSTDHSEVTGEHVNEMIRQLSAIIAEGIDSGEFAPTEPRRAAHALFYATAGFHHPDLAETWMNPASDAALDEVLALLLGGLKGQRPMFDQ